jgi:lysozyme
MGAAGVNDRGIYDDAIFVVLPDRVVSFNANTDPSGYRPGKGTGDEKGMAVLQPGVWNFNLGLHRGKYLALRQRGSFTVLRDGFEHSYSDTGDGFGINIHCGGVNTTSSLGCQTIVPEQYDEFINLVQNSLKKLHPTQHPWSITVPCLVTEGLQA